MTGQENAGAFEMVPETSCYLMPTDALQAPSVEASLAEAERKGFRLAVIGRTCALVPIALFYLATYGYPNNIYIAVLVLVAAAAGLAPLALVDGRYERASRYAFFAFDVAVLTAMLALVPLSSGGDVPQNIVFLSTRGEYYFVVVAISVLALSPVLVLWTGLCAVVGLASATSQPFLVEPSVHPSSLLALALLR